MTGAVRVELLAAQRAYSAFVRAGFPTSAPVVKYLSGEASPLRQLVTAQSRQDLD